MKTNSSWPLRSSLAWSELSLPEWDFSCLPHQLLPPCWLGSSLAPKQAELISHLPLASELCPMASLLSPSFYLSKSVHVYANNMKFTYLPGSSSGLLYTIAISFPATQFLPAADTTPLQPAVSVQFCEPFTGPRVRTRVRQGRHLGCKF